MLYQPILLRILHGIAAVLVIFALISGFWVYDTYDGRWGRLMLPTLGDIQGIHGTIALTFLLLFPFFALYGFRLGERRLLRLSSLQQLKQFGEPVWWISLHHLTNTLMLFAVTFALITGRMMKEEWLPAGDLNNPWYLAHLVAWMSAIAALALHVLLGAKVGGVPLLVSMFRWNIRPEDRPRIWLRGFVWFRGFKDDRADSILKTIEIIVLTGILLAFMMPIFHL
ncbi:MAG: cytochrome b/b6 domain-containing protein [Cyanobacteriota bacterium]|nr:cytochrome b/b6 domain-containing protein [Cyanobacteriota bacterium]